MERMGKGVEGMGIEMERMGMIDIEGMGMGIEGMRMEGTKGMEMGIGIGIRLGMGIDKMRCKCEWVE